MSIHREGELYKILSVCGKSFEVHYGYYSETERNMWEPTPIYPNFTEHPVYTDEGRPFVTAEQAVCEHYKPKQMVSGENWCNDCKYFCTGEELIGVCNCSQRQIKGE